jgi:hypothetical protein
MDTLEEVETDQLFFINRLHDKKLSLGDSRSFSDPQIATNTLLSVNNRFGLIACGIKNGISFSIHYLCNRMCDHSNKIST